MLIGIYGYAIQIYADFSGYTDIAIGVALLLGFRFPTNFDRPYSALSLREFWKRWHITLSSWLRDYLYIPLGGNRGKQSDTYRNLLLTMVLGGLWHGSTWNFVIWGFIHGIALSVERILPNRRNHPVIRWFVTFHIVCFAWVFFRADSLSSALDVIRALASLPSSAELTSSLSVLLLVGMMAAQFVPYSKSEDLKRILSRQRILVQGLTFGFGLVLIDLFGPEGVAPFIYFQF